MARDLHARRLAPAPAVVGVESLLDDAGVLGRRHHSAAVSHAEFHAAREPAAAGGRELEYSRSIRAAAASAFFLFENCIYKRIEANEEQAPSPAVPP